MKDGFRYDLIAPGDRVLCALSGGGDSMYLLCRLLEGAEKGGYQVGAAHYHHGLRSASDGELAFVEGWCAARGVPLWTGRGQVAQEAARRGRGVEETARAMRYDFLYSVAHREGYTLIATGHHAGDNAETVLMHLIRGSGARGLGGIPPRRGMLIRPMLEVERGEITRYLSTHGIPHVEDESNSDPAYTRNRMRSQVIPLLEEMNPRAVAHITAAAAILREENDLLEELARPLAQGVWEGGCFLLSVSPLAQAPRPLALRALALAAGGVGQAPGRPHLEEILALALGESTQGRLEVPGGVVWRSWDTLVFACGGEPVPPKPASLILGEQSWGHWRLTCREETCPGERGEGLWLVPGDYTLRSRREGDTLCLPGRRTKTLKKLMTEGKIPACLRPLVPVLVQGERVAAVPGLGAHERFRAVPGEMALHITWTKETHSHA